MTVLGIIAFGFAGLIGLAIVYLVIVIFAPVLKVKPQPFVVPTFVGNSLPNPLYISEEIHFEVDGERIVGTLFLPRNVREKLPCIVMNHGFGATQDMLPLRYPERFTGAGYAVMTYDYRHFGGSDGTPRQMYSARKQIADCQAVIEYVRNLEPIDPDRIIVWGTSGAGGYGLLVAAADKRIACVISQCPGMDHKSDSKMALERDGLWFYLGLVPHAQRDKGRSRFGLSPHTIPIVGKPGTTAMLTAPGAFDGYSRFCTSNSKNEVCARIMLTHQGYDPLAHAEEVQCPVLIQICDNDNLASPAGAERAANLLGDFVEVKRYPIGHFDIYFDEHFVASTDDQIEFLHRHASLEIETN